MTAAVGPLRLDQLPHIGASAVCMGVFDGVHRGHAAMLAAARRAARACDATAVALVFEPHPEEVLRPGTRVPRLVPVDEVLARIESDHATRPVLVRFDDALRALTAEEFLVALAPAIELRALVMSPETAFGRGRGGTLERMRDYGRQRGFEVITVDPLLVDGEAVSSTRIRRALAAGDITLAAALGAHPPFLAGTVVEGDHRGRRLGFPTANLAFDYVPAMPALGIYLGRVSVPERGVGPGHPALVSVGVRPTFHEDGRVLVEAHLLDYDGDLYGARLELELLARLRNERRFDSVEELVGQMRRDEAEARAILEAGMAGEPSV